MIQIRKTMHKKEKNEAKTENNKRRRNMFTVKFNFFLLSIDMAINKHNI